jgi:hypothetical protein
MLYLSAVKSWKFEQDGALFQYSSIVHDALSDVSWEFGVLLASPDLMPLDF